MEVRPECDVERLPCSRSHAYTQDFAAEHLRGRLIRPLYFQGQSAITCAPRTVMQTCWSHNAEAGSELVLGEPVDFYGLHEGYACVQSVHDGYVGHVCPTHISPISRYEHRQTGRYRISRLTTILLAGPQARSQRLADLSFGSYVDVEASDGAYVRLKTGGYIHSSAICKDQDWGAGSWHETAHMFLGCPYVWGGRSGFGVDCSGLVQMVYSRSGYRLLRDTDQQERTAGKPVDIADIRSGDLVYFKGHVGIALDAKFLLHATAHTLTVCIEPLPDVAARAGGITSVRRLSS